MAEVSEVEAMLMAEAAARQAAEGAVVMAGPEAGEMLKAEFPGAEAMLKSEFPGAEAMLKSEFPGVEAMLMAETAARRPAEDAVRIHACLNVKMLSWVNKSGNCGCSRLGL